MTLPRLALLACALTLALGSASAQTPQGAAVTPAQAGAAKKGKTMQEVITLIVFAGFSVLVLKESLTWKHGLGFALIAAGAAVIFYKPGTFS